MPEMNEAAGARPVVYLVDDSEELRDLYEMVLTELGCVVTCFASGESALEQIPKLPRPELLIVDYTLPRMSGESFVIKLRTQLPELHSSTRILGFSNYDPQTPLIGGFRKVTDVYMEKPFDLKDFSTTLSHLLKTL